MAKSKQPPRPRPKTLDELLDKVSNAREELIAIERTLERLRNDFDYERASGLDWQISTRAKWRSSPGAPRGALQKSLTPPTLLEMVICQQQRGASLPARNLVAALFRRVNRIFRAIVGSAAEGRSNALSQRQYRFAEHKLGCRSSAFRAVLPEITTQVPCAIVHDLY
jgi:hypothetical protein